ncbi:MAG TPA: glutamyl-tRNA reductase [Paenalcaligenes sp.]|nr:glutamyl-tRNA reductase [Paenalcaligenes sp.]
MTLDVLTFGLNHVSAPVEVRERVAFPMNVVRPALDALRSTFGTSVSEAAILSTCNRTEIYCAAEPYVVEHLPQWMAEFNRVRATDLTPHLYRYERNKAVRHAFRVASGLDSMVLGEPQILGQMKDAMRAANEAGALGTLLHQLFQQTFSVAKTVRTQTAIGAHSVSMAAAAVRLAERVFGNLGETNVLFIGAGEMIELCAAHFATKKPKKMVVANRTRERAETLASRFHANTMRLADLPDEIENYDVVVSSTASTLPILGLGMVERAIKARRHRPMVMVDLAVPRDIESEVARLSDVYLYSVDDLAGIVQKASDARQAAVLQAESIIDNQVQHFMQWLENRALVPTLVDVQERAEQVTQHDLQRAQRMLARGDDPAEVLQWLSHTLSQRFLHGPLTTLKNSQGEQRDTLLQVLPELLPTTQRRRS